MEIGMTHSSKEATTSELQCHGDRHQHLNQHLCCQLLLLCEFCETISVVLTEQSYPQVQAWPLGKRLQVPTHISGLSYQYNRWNIHGGIEPACL